jgi:TPR repeat protein
MTRVWALFAAVGVFGCAASAPAESLECPRAPSAQAAATVATIAATVASPAVPPTPEPTRSTPSGADIEAEAQLGIKLLSDPSPAGLRAPEHLKKACDAGHALACNDLGWAYERGFGTLGRSDALAQQLYRTSCELGEALGCRNGAKVLRDTNSADAAALVYQSCSNNDQESCEMLAGIAAAAKAACFKNPKRCNNWGVLLKSGWGTKKDEALALHFYESACAAAVREACSNAGRAHQNGAGTVANPRQALARFQKACALESDADCFRAQKLEATQPAIAPRTAPK